MEILFGLLMGTAYVGAPGPITIEMLRQGMCGGLRASLAVQGGSVLGRIVYGSIAVFGAGGLLQQEEWQQILSIGGMALLVYLGIRTIRNAGLFAAPTCAFASLRPSTRSAQATGALLSLANPLNVAFWFSIGGAALRQPQPEGRTFLAAFAAGCVAASLLTALIAAFWQARLSGAAVRTVSWAGGLALIGFGLRIGIASVGFAR